MVSTSCFDSLTRGRHREHLKVVDTDKPGNQLQNSEYKELERTFVGRTPAILEIKRRILQIGKCDLTVLISGESGTGKEVVARAIHRFSMRAHKPFIKLNCAGLPDTLFESELFGFERGAFTGAFKDKPGKFQLAHLGTILLDEVAEVPLSNQAKLLQILEDKEFFPLGSTVNIRVNTRILAATNANIDKMVSERRFRPDLYYRLSVVQVHLPPLRERRGDIDLLCDHFLSKYAALYNKEHKPLADRIRNEFYKYSWPGNVRELENLIQCMTALEDEKIFYEKIKDRELPMLKDLCKKAVCKVERDAIGDVLARTDWNRRKAAAILGTSYKTLLGKIKEYGIKQS
jgi:two-component system response regulator AtoC